jgi:hypothetical protein
METPSYMTGNRTALSKKTAKTSKTSKHSIFVFFGVLEVFAVCFYD